ncbi:energy transducer TonB [Pseudomonas sp. O230]|uniref:energy transducer TonB n=1 Tax=Pseudomonas sp. O230 TaxID=3159450 RepID=UPI00387B81AC
MRWFLCVLLLVLSIEVRAGEVFLIPENNPKPVYPVALSRSGITGALNVSFTVHADGSVSQVEASKDAHPDLVEASRTAVSQWRYKPWEISIERPAQIQVVAPMVFRLDDKMPIHANEALKKLSCGEVAKAALRLADYSWVDMPVFSWTRSYLTHSLSPAQLPEARRLELIAKLNKSVPSIIRRCNTHQATRYVHFLPKEIRELL